MPANKFCELDNLSNEASVEQFFVSRLLPDLGYRDHQIKPKTSLQELVVSLGVRRMKYKPDYALEVGHRVRWVLDAKSPDESLDDHIEQCSGYCLALNRGYDIENPVRYFVLTNGLTTRVYEWDRDDPILELGFEDFQDGNLRYQQLQYLLKPEQFSPRTITPSPDGPTHTLRKREISEVNADFAWCHQFIYRKDNLSQSAAFVEFVKLIFLKLLSDREIHEKHPEFTTLSEITLPASEVRFSKRWIEEREADHPNPIDALQFQALIQRLESEIQKGKRKRIFDIDERIDLTAETIKGVVERLEHTDLFGIDADLNGRLFETFLNATMRGKDLGQFFTPRSVVKLATRLARLTADREHIDIVLDACCGTGGFLIEALAQMWDQLDHNPSYTDEERNSLKREVTTERIYGIDVARDPALARIARMNMYLHGDGGASIYQADALDKDVQELPTDTPEIRKETAELRGLLADGDFADVVLTNPPFAKEYQRKYPREDKILNGYTTAFDSKGGRHRPRPSLRSSVMFLERYHDLLKPGGRLITVIDDSILGGTKYRAVRDFIRAHFVVRAVVSLPGDAFQRSKARVKTSLLILEKKRTPDEAQPSLFMCYCTTVGLDDSPRQRTLPIDAENRDKALREIKSVSQLYESFLKGGEDAKKWTVPPERIRDRMDVKNCLLDPFRNVETWEQANLEISDLNRWIEVVFPTTGEDDEVSENLLDTQDSDELVTLLRVRYDGFAETGDTIEASSSTYSNLYKVHTGDLVISNINAVNGAIAVVPEPFDGTFVTTEFTVCRAKENVDPRLVWAMLRSPEARSNLLLVATGIGRSRVKPGAALSLKLPVPDQQLAKKAAATLKHAEDMEREAAALRQQALWELESSLGLDNEEAQAILAAFKPPR
jgi:type I restriction enzyme M protein